MADAAFPNLKNFRAVMLDLWHMCRRGLSVIMECSTRFAITALAKARVLLLCVCVDRFEVLERT